MRTTTERRSLATPPTAVNVPHHESEIIYNNKNRQDFHHHCERVAKACMLGRCASSFHSSLSNAFIWRKKKGMGWYRWQLGFDFVLFIMKGECTCSSPLTKTEYVVGY